MASGGSDNPNRYCDYLHRLRRVTGLPSELLDREVLPLRDIPHKDDPRRDRSFQQVLDIERSRDDLPLLVLVRSDDATAAAASESDYRQLLRRVVVPPTRLAPHSCALRIPNARDPRRVKACERANHPTWSIGPPTLVVNDLVPVEEETCPVLTIDVSDWPHSKSCWIELCPHECNVARSELDVQDVASDDEMLRLARPGSVTATSSAGETEALLDCSLEVIEFEKPGFDAGDDVRPMLSLATEDVYVECVGETGRAAAAAARVERLPQRFCDDDDIGTGITIVKEESTCDSLRPLLPRVDEKNVDVIDLCEDEEHEEVKPKIEKELEDENDVIECLGVKVLEVVILDDDDDDVEVMCTVPRTCPVATVVKGEANVPEIGENGKGTSLRPCGSAGADKQTEHTVVLDDVESGGVDDLDAHPRWENAVECVGVVEPVLENRESDRCAELASVSVRADDNHNVREDGGECSSGGEHDRTQERESLTVLEAEEPEEHRKISECAIDESRRSGHGVDDENSASTENCDMRESEIPMAFEELNEEVKETSDVVAAEPCESTNCNNDNGVLPESTANDDGNSQGEEMSITIDANKQANLTDCSTVLNCKSISNKDDVPPENVTTDDCDNARGQEIPIISGAEIQANITDSAIFKNDESISKDDGTSVKSATTNECNVRDEEIVPVIDTEIQVNVTGGAIVKNDESVNKNDLTSPENAMTDECNVLDEEMLLVPGAKIQESVTDSVMTESCDSRSDSKDSPPSEYTAGAKVRDTPNQEIETALDTSEQVHCIDLGITEIREDETAQVIEAGDECSQASQVRETPADASEGENKQLQPVADDTASSEASSTRTKAKDTFLRLSEHALSVIPIAQGHQADICYARDANETRGTVDVVVAEKRKRAETPEKSHEEVEGKSTPGLSEAKRRRWQENESDGPVFVTGTFASARFMMQSIESRQDDGSKRCRRGARLVELINVRTRPYERLMVGRRLANGRSRDANLALNFLTVYLRNFAVSWSCMNYFLNNYGDVSFVRLMQTNDYVRRNEAFWRERYNHWHQEDHVSIKDVTETKSCDLDKKVNLHSTHSAINRESTNALHKDDQLIETSIIETSYLLNHSPEPVIGSAIKRISQDLQSNSALESTQLNSSFKENSFYSSIFRSTDTETSSNNFEIHRFRKRHSLPTAIVPQPYNCAKRPRSHSHDVSKSSNSTNSINISSIKLTLKRDQSNQKNWIASQGNRSTLTRCSLDIPEIDANCRSKPISSKHKSSFESKKICNSRMQVKHNAYVDKDVPELDLNDFENRHIPVKSSNLENCLSPFLKSIVKKKNPSLKDVNLDRDYSRLSKRHKLSDTSIVREIQHNVNIDVNDVKSSLEYNLQTNRSLGLRKSSNDYTKELLPKTHLSILKTYNFLDYNKSHNTTANENFYSTNNIASDFSLELNEILPETCSIVLDRPKCLDLSENNFIVSPDRHLDSVIDNSSNDSSDSRLTIVVPETVTNDTADSNCDIHIDHNFNIEKDVIKINKQSHQTLNCNVEKDILKENSLQTQECVSNKVKLKKRNKLKKKFQLWFNDSDTSEVEDLIKIKRNKTVLSEISPNVASDLIQEDSEKSSETCSIQIAKLKDTCFTNPKSEEISENVVTTVPLNIGVVKESHTVDVKSNEDFKLKLCKKSQIYIGQKTNDITQSNEIEENQLNTVLQNVYENETSESTELVVYESDVTASSKEDIRSNADPEKICENYICESNEIQEKNFNSESVTMYRSNINRLNDQNCIDTKLNEIYETNNTETNVSEENQLNIELKIICERDTIEANEVEKCQPHKKLEKELHEDVEVEKTGKNILKINSISSEVKSVEKNMKNNSNNIETTPSQENITKINSNAVVAKLCSKNKSNDNSNVNVNKEGTDTENNNHNLVLGISESELESSPNLLKSTEIISSDISVDKSTCNEGEHEQNRSHTVSPDSQEMSDFNILHSPVSGDQVLPDSTRLDEHLEGGDFDFLSSMCETKDGSEYSEDEYDVNLDCNIEYENQNSAEYSTNIENLEGSGNLIERFENNIVCKTEKNQEVEKSLETAARQDMTKLNTSQHSLKKLPRFYNDCVTNIINSKDKMNATKHIDLSSYNLHISDDDDDDIIILEDVISNSNTMNKMDKKIEIKSEKISQLKTIISLDSDGEEIDEAGNELEEENRNEESPKDQMNNITKEKDNKNESEENQPESERIIEQIQLRPSNTETSKQSDKTDILDMIISCCENPAGSNNVTNTSTLMNEVVSSSTEAGNIAAMAPVESTAVPRDTLSPMALEIDHTGASDTSLSRKNSSPITLVIDECVDDTSSINSLALDNCSTVTTNTSTTVPAEVQTCQSVIDHENNDQNLDIEVSSCKKTVSKSAVQFTGNVKDDLNNPNILHEFNLSREIVAPEEIKVEVSTAVENNSEQQTLYESLESIFKETVKINNCFTKVQSPATTSEAHISIMTNDPSADNSLAAPLIIEVSMPNTQTQSAGAYDLLKDININLVDEIDEINDTTVNSETVNNTTASSSTANNSCFKLRDINELLENPQNSSTSKNTLLNQNSEVNNIPPKSSFNNLPNDQISSAGTVNVQNNNLYTTNSTNQLNAGAVLITNSNSTQNVVPHQSLLYHNSLNNVQSIIVPPLQQMANMYNTIPVAMPIENGAAPQLYNPIQMTYQVLQPIVSMIPPHVISVPQNNQPLSYDNSQIVPSVANNANGNSRKLVLASSIYRDRFAESGNCPLELLTNETNNSNLNIPNIVPQLNIFTLSLPPLEKLILPAPFTLNLQESPDSNNRKIIEYKKMILNKMVSSLKSMGKKTSNLHHLRALLFYETITEETWKFHLNIITVIQCIVLFSYLFLDKINETLFRAIKNSINATESLDQDSFNFDDVHVMYNKLKAKGILGEQIFNQQPLLMELQAACNQDQPINVAEVMTNEQKKKFLEQTRVYIEIYKTDSNQCQLPVANPNHRQDRQNSNKSGSSLIASQQNLGSALACISVNDSLQKSSSRNMRKILPALSVAEKLDKNKFHNSSTVSNTPSTTNVNAVNKQDIHRIHVTSLTEEDHNFSTLCLKCGKASQVVCSSCEIASYCSRECQQNHWKEQHYKTCKNNTNIT